MDATEVPVLIGNLADPDRVIAAIEAECAAHGLLLRNRSGLAKYRGCTHWHYGLPNRHGTLELTFWPKESRCWASVRENRSADWIPPMLGSLCPSIERACRGAEPSESKNVGASVGCAQ